MIGTITLNPSIDQHIVIDKVAKDDAIRRELVRDVVCGMEVDPVLAPFRALRGAREFHFCSLLCRERFLADERGSKGDVMEHQERS